MPSRAARGTPPPGEPASEETPSDEIARLRRLARLWGVATRYRDGLGQRREPSPETLLAVLAALGAPVSAMADVPGALAERRRGRAIRPLPSSAVLWEGASPVIPLTVPAALADAPIGGRLILETGDETPLRWRAGETPVVARKSAHGEDADGEEHVRRRLRLETVVPHGHHRLEIEVGDRRGALRLVSAPLVAHPHPERRWGVFLPLHALRERERSGLADLGTLARLTRWAGGLGASAVGCLPLLAAFLDPDLRPFDPSPYAPASRLFWNELWVDLSQIPELPECREARDLLAGAETVARRRALTEGEAAGRVGCVDYGAEHAWRKSVWQALADHFFARAPESRRERLRELLRARPDLDAYASFRAVGEQLGTPWQEWPQSLRDGPIPEETDPAAERLGPYRRHLYAQLVAHEQIERLGRRAAAAGTDLYLDLPLGVHASSFDVWRHRRLFVSGMAAGAPPDAFFVHGQSWGIPPLSPERLRADGPDAWRAVVAHSMSACGVLRVDHVMQLERLFWIPSGAEPSEGTYVGYPREELLATLVLESHRAGCAVVGEDLGTVPGSVRRALDRHGMARIFAVPFELQPNPFRALPPPPEGVLAALGTHDTATFAGFWKGRDLELRRELGWLDETERDRLVAEREVVCHALVAHLRSRRLLPRIGEPQPEQMARAVLELLAEGPAAWVLVNLEDLWGEEEPQNVPGTGPERPNWRRRAGRTLAELEADPEIRAFLEGLGRLRQHPREEDAEPSVDDEASIS